MKVAEIWRYPVKSMAGEMIATAHLNFLGIPGDRVVHVEDGHGRFITARTHPGLLAHKATTGPNGEPLVDGQLWIEGEVGKKVIDAAGPGACLVRDESETRFDILPLLVATDGAVAAFGHDRRRLRPNILISGVDGLAERNWPGRVLRIGSAMIGVRDLRGRCVMTTFDPDTLAQDRNVLREIVQKFSGTLALNCFVIRPGEIRVGDSVELLNAQEAELTEENLATPGPRLQTN